MLSNSSAGKNGFGVELVLMDWEKIAVNLYRLIDSNWFNALRTNSSGHILLNR